jgi:hypothetical protein
MASWLRHILICSTALAGVFAGERVEAAFLAPQLDAAMSGPAEPGDTPREAPRPERADAVVASSTSMTGVGMGVTIGGFSGQVLGITGSTVTELPRIDSRLKLARERVEICQGFLLDILRPPR